MKSFLSVLFGRSIAPKHQDVDACPLDLDDELERHRERLKELEKRLIVLEDDLRVSREGMKHVD